MVSLSYKEDNMLNVFILIKVEFIQYVHMELRYINISVVFLVQWCTPPIVNKLKSNLNKIIHANYLFSLAHNLGSTRPVTLFQSIILFIIWAACCTLFWNKNGACPLFKVSFYPPAWAKRREICAKEILHHISERLHCIRRAPPRVLLPSSLIAYLRVVSSSNPE